MDFENGFDDGRVSALDGLGLHVVRQTHVVGRVLGVPQQLLRHGMSRIEMQIAEQPLALADRHATERADAILIVARAMGMPFRMIDVDLGSLIELRCRGQRGRQIDPPVARAQAEDFDAPNHALCPVDV